MIFELHYSSISNQPYAVIPDSLSYQPVGQYTKCLIGLDDAVWNMQKMMKNAFPNGEHYVANFNGYENAVSL